MGLQRPISFDMFCYRVVWIATDCITLKGNTLNIKNRPDTDQPFSRVRIGTNTFINTQAMVTMGGFAPLLIGKGDVPRVWLSVPPAQPGGDWLTQNQLSGMPVVLALP